MFERQKTYTREQIHAALGGNPRAYLPVKGGRVVAGCFKTDLNPGAPGGGSCPLARTAPSKRPRS